MILFKSINKLINNKYPCIHTNCINWTKKTLKEVSIALKKNEITSYELTKQSINNIINNRKLNIFTYENFDQALKLAKESDKRRKNSLFPLSIIDGIPIAFKDIFCTKDMPTTASSNMLKDYYSPYESTATNRLLSAGAIPLGKLNMDEFGMGSTTTNSIFGSTIHPLSKDKPFITGGSSGGSAAAVASYCCFAALGSDTGGSVRQPASMCGVVGLKPTYGRISRYGMIQYASSLDTVGILTRTTSDAEILLNILSGYDTKDTTSLKDKMINDKNQTKCFKFDEKNDHLLRGINIGLPVEYNIKELSKKAKDSWNKCISLLLQAGAKVSLVHLPWTKAAISCYYIIACAEAASNLAKYDGIRYGYRTKMNELDNISTNKYIDLYSNNRSIGFGSEVQKRILSGNFVLSSESFNDYYKSALMIREKIINDFSNVFINNKIDILITPTNPITSYPIKDINNNNNINTYLNDLMTLPSSLAGLPAISLPVNSINNNEKNINLPLGIQFIANNNEEQKLLHVAKCIENRDLYTIK